MSVNNTYYYESGVSNGDKIPEVVGLEAFQKFLERDFFAEATIDICFDEKTNCFDLIIDLSCNFSLTESLFHFNNGNWGSFKEAKQSNNKSTSQFQQYFEYLNEINYHNLDLKELSIHLGDTTIVIDRLYKMGIVEQLSVIMDTICSNFVHLTKGLTEMPCEIFVPIYEEKEEASGTDPLLSFNTTKGPEDYFKFWGVYFDSSPQMQVYDFGAKKVFSGDFRLIS